MRLEAYVDFGSDCSLIRLTDAKSLRLKEFDDNLPTIKGFGNSITKPLYKIETDLTIDEIEARIIMYVVEDKYLHTPVLLGQNFTELPFLTVFKDSEKLVFHASPSSYVHKEVDITYKLYVLHDTTVKQGGLIEVYMNEPYSGDIFIDGGTRTNPEQEYHLHSGCYKVENSKGVVYVTALSNSALEFRANALIARAKVATQYKCLKVHTQTNDPVYSELDRAEIKAGDGLDTHTQDRLYKLLQQYRNCFAQDLRELGCTHETEIKIDLHDNSPVFYRPYRMSYSEREKVREIVEDLLQNDIIQESESNYASPILLVRKKNGEQRLCVDFRALNNKTTKDKYPLPLIEDQMSILSGNKYFTTLDLASGYYQIPVAENSKHLTAFVTPDGHFEFKRMPFGLANAPAVFQRLINKILGARRFTFALAYMDDLLVPSTSIDEGFERLEEVLELLQQAGLTLKLPKCSFFNTEIEYLGYEISSSGIRPSERKILAVKNFPVPRNVHEVRQFLGLASYFRKFVKGFGEIARPLTTLLKKDSSWHWTTCENNSFTELKDRLIDRPILALYDPKLETELHTDASSLGLGGILMQWQRNPRELKPVAYFSRQTTPEERHMHSYELETLAVVCSLKKFRVYLLGLNFVVFTDCNALKTTLTRRDLIPRIARWWLQISEFDFRIEYRAGLKMTHVDALSRNPTPEQPTETEELSHNFPTVLNISSDNWLLTLQLADPELLRISKILKPNKDDESMEVRKNYTIKDNVLFRKTDAGQLRLVIPKSARWQICKMNHDDLGHFGYTKTLERVQSKYWFPKLRKFVKKYVAACINCAYTKDSASTMPSGHLHPIDKVGIPFHTLHLDHIGPFVRSKLRNNYILTIVDGFTKYVFARPVKDTKTKSVLKVLENLFYDFGAPTRIISDRGTAFTSAQFKSFCTENSIKHILNAVACPRANGQAERFNQTILNALSTQNFNGDEREWDKQLGKVQWGINNTIHATTKKCPSELLFGLKLSNPAENRLASGINDVQSPDKINETRQKASDNIKVMQQKQKEKYDLGRSAAPTFNIGDLVKITKTSFRNDGKSTKLLPKFIGPYKVVNALGNDRYEISTVPGFKQSRHYQSVVASDRMRPWIHTKALDVCNNSSGSESENGESEGDANIAK